MFSMSKSRKVDFSLPSPREKKLATLVNGIETVFPSGATIVIEGTSYNQAAFLAKAQSFLNPEVAARQGHLALQKLVAAKDANAKPADLFYDQVKQALVPFVGSTNVDTLAAYGVAPRRKTSQATSAETVMRAAKANETRQARDTLGPKEKASIKGAVPTSVTVTGDGKIVPAAPGSKGGAAPTT
jgi:hypothetical protein